LYKNKIGTLEREITKIVDEEFYERELRLAEMEARKADNIINHKEEIEHRPRR
jgi:ATP-dependent RNA helicase DDX27